MKAAVRIELFDCIDPLGHLAVTLTQLRTGRPARPQHWIAANEHELPTLAAGIDIEYTFLLQAHQQNRSWRIADARLFEDGTQPFVYGGSILPQAAPDALSLLYRGPETRQFLLQIPPEGGTHEERQGPHQETGSRGLKGKFEPCVTSVLFKSVELDRLIRARRNLQLQQTILLKSPDLNSDLHRAIALEDIENEAVAGNGCSFDAGKTRNLPDLLPPGWQVSQVGDVAEEPGSGNPKIFRTLKLDISETPGLLDDFRGSLHSPQTCSQPEICRQSAPATGGGPPLKR